MEREQVDYSPNYLKVVWDNWHKVVAGTLVCAIAGAIFTFLAPRMYQSTATLLVYPPLFKEVEEQSTRRTPEQMQLELDEMMPGTFPVETYKTIAKSKGLIQEVIKAVTDSRVVGLEGALLEDVSENLEVELVQLGRRTTQRGITYSQTILFHARADTPELAAQLAQTWAELFKKRVDKLASTGIDETFTSISSMWTQTVEDLSKAENALVEFKKRWNLDLMKLEKSSKETLLALMEDQLDQTEVDVASASAELAALQEELKDKDMAKIDTLWQAPPAEVYWELKKSASSTSETIISPEDGLRTEVHNPNYTVTRDQEVVAQRKLQGLEGRRDRLISKVGELRTDIGALQTSIAEQDTAQKRLERDVLTFENTYTLVASKLEKGKIAKTTSKTSDIQIAGDAVKPDRPAGGGRAYKVGAAALVGALLGIAYVVADYSIRMGPSVASG
jgi:uncharacterized protein involved in exopolysaccharide biosynthesis